MESLYYLFIFPIESFMRLVLEWGHNLTNSYGIAIILLSLVVSLFTMPLYYFAEKLKKNHQEELDKLKPGVDFFKNNFKGQERQYYLQALYRVHKYHPLSAVKSALGLLLQIPFFFAAFHLLGDYPGFKGVSFGVVYDLSKPDGLLFGQNLLPIIMVAVNLGSAYFYSQSMGRSDKYQLWGLAGLFFVLLYSEPAALLIYWIFNNIFSLLKGFLENRYNFEKLKHVLIRMLEAPYELISKNNMFKWLFSSLYAQAVFLFLGIIFIYSAIPMASSDTGMYTSKYIFVVAYLLIYFMVSALVAGMVYKIIPKVFRYLATAFVVFMALSGLWFVYIVPFDLGQITSLTMPMFSMGDNLFSDKMLSLFIWVFMFLLVALFLKPMKKIVLKVFIVMNFVLTGYALAASFHPESINSIGKKQILVLSDLEEEERRKKLEVAYAFSSQSNVLVVMMDMFQGNVFADILSEYPEYKKKLEGFVYFPNTLSHGANTWLSISGIAGGSDYRINLLEDKLFKNKGLMRLDEDSHFYKTQSYLDSFAMADKYKHTYLLVDPAYSKCKELEARHLKICLDADEVLVPPVLLNDLNKIRQKHHQASAIATAGYFAKLSFILTVPNRLKSSVVARMGSNIFLSSYVDNIMTYSQYVNMHDFASIKSKQKTFKFVRNVYTHDPWMTNAQCKVSYEGFPGYQGLFYTAKCGLDQLIKLFDKLRQLGVYDKTKIIIVSDHGRKDIVTENYNIKHSAASALLLVKDFRSKGNLETSMQFMSNIDAYGLALSGVSEGLDIELDPIHNPPKNRELIFVKETSPWVSYNIKDAFVVKDSIFDVKNWHIWNRD